MLLLLIGASSEPLRGKTSEKGCQLLVIYPTLDSKSHLQLTLPLPSWIGKLDKMDVLCSVDVN